MGTFTPIAMKCTQEQFNTVKPKLKGLDIMNIEPFTDCNYLVNNLWGSAKIISNITNTVKGDFNRQIHEYWNEEIFLKACGIEAETLQEKAIRLENELEEVKQQIKEKNKIKIGDWVKRTYRGIEIFKADHTHDYRYINSERHIYQKITNPEIINILENLYNE